MFSLLARRGLQRFFRRYRRAKIRRTICLPPKSLNTNVALPRAGTDVGVINNPILLAVRRFDEGAVARSENFGGMGEDRLRVLYPRLQIEHITARPRQQAQAIIIIPKCARGINDEQVTVVPECFRPFVDMWIIALFPGTIRLGNANPLATNRP